MLIQKIRKRIVCIAPALGRCQVGGQDNALGRNVHPQSCDKESLHGRGEAHSNPFGMLRLRQSLVHFAIGKTAGVIIGFGWLLMLVRVLSARDYATYFAFTGLGEVLIILWGFGLDNMVSRYVPELHAMAASRTLKRVVWKIIIARTLVLGLGCWIVAILAPQILSLLSIDYATKAFGWYTICVFLEGLARLVETVFDSMLLQRMSLASSLARYGTRVVFLGYFYVTGHVTTLDMWTFAEASAFIMCLIWTLFLCYRTLNNSRILPEQKSLIPANIGRYVKFAFPSYCASLCYLMLSMETIKILTPRLFDPNLSALFGLCVSLSAILSRYLPSFLLGSMIRPVVVASTLRSDPSEHLNQIFRALVTVNSFIVIPAAIMAITVGDQLVRIISGGKFLGGGMILGILFFQILTNSVQYIYSLIGAAKEDGRGILIAVVVASIVFGVSVLYVSLSDGSPSLLILGMILADISNAFVLRRRIRNLGSTLRLPIASILKILISSGLATVVVQWCISLYFPTTSPFVVLSFSVAVYLAIAAIVRPFNANDRRYINTLLPVALFVW